ncbi:MAG: hypothetical protein M1837_005153 [Sclerophora amabilis]|nr:MAG: hypothetical protein M1837_005153 [Sclerophora amabilis]
MRNLTKLTSQIQHGQRLQGRKTYYNVIDRLSRKRDNLWLARDPEEKVVLIKTAPLPRFNNEVEALELCRGQKSIRQLLDVTESPRSMVLEFLDTNLYSASGEQQLERQDVKRAIKAALEGLAVLHHDRRAHTDMKPDNLLANRGSGESRFGDIKLGDLGDSVSEDVSTNTGQHIISAPIYRAPEVMLNIRWTTAVDIWSLGATLICYLLRRHIFVPRDVEPGDERFPFLVLMLQTKYFGPFPEKFFQLLDDEGAAVLRYVLNECDGETEIFSKAGPEKISREDKDFICYLMRPDPRDRPSSIEALRHPWLEDVNAC